jgi:hypothetical protein
MPVIGLQNPIICPIAVTAVTVQMVAVMAVAVWEEK